MATSNENIIKINIDDFIYNLCVTNLRKNKLTDQEKKQYTEYLLNPDSHKRNTEALDERMYDKIYLKASFKYAKKLIKENDTNGTDKNPNQILKWISDNGDTFINNKVDDLYLIGSARELLHKQDGEEYVIQKEDINKKCCTDYQEFKFYQKEKKDNPTISLSDDEELYLFTNNIIGAIEKKEKIIKNLSFLYELFESSAKMEPRIYSNVLFIFRIYCTRIISKKEKFIERDLQLFKKNLNEIINYEEPIEPKLHQEICNFLIFYYSDLCNVLPSQGFVNLSIEGFENTINEVLQKVYTLDHNCAEVNVYIKYAYGLYLYQCDKGANRDDESKKLNEQSEVYFRAASEKNYFKAMYFLSEIVKKYDSKEALDLYDKIIKYDNSNIDSNHLNAQSDKFERACALYQKGLVYAEGLYSKPIDWEIVDQCWGDPDSDLCITKINEKSSEKYIDTKYLNLQFIKYKADHGLLEAKHMYFEICTKEKLSNEDDILIIYMHELCLFSNDKRYLKEMEEYARRLDVGEGVEKDKKRAAAIKQKIEDIKRKKQE